MEKRTLSVVKRTSVGKNALKSVRREGLIPAVMYGHSDNMLFSINEREFSKKFTVISENTIIDLKDGKDVYHVLIKSFDENVMKGQILHIDFYEVEKGTKLTTMVPIRFEGDPVGVKLGGSLNHLVHEISVECLPKDIPTEIIVNIESLNVGQSVTIGDLSEIEGVKILMTEDQVITHVVKAGAEEVAEEVATEEEVAE
ncbi:MAG: hypothetical protein B6229_09125 [Spirochaetaceae bacterium 4572_7]|nr:MAG: hypothetical protein B6229_09125 [Spirochaetaceae bacterium 4572_7]